MPSEIPPKLETRPLSVIVASTVNDNLQEKIKGLKKVVMPSGDTYIKIQSIKWYDLLTAWAYYKAQATILTYMGGNMGESVNKPWYTSKTIWTNLAMALWTFIGPLIGIPTFDPEIMVGVFTVVNLLLRLITKGAVTIS